MPQHGEGTSYPQQHTVMSKQGIKHPNPRGQNIIQFIKDQNTKGQENFLMLDANEEIGKTTQGITAILSECSLTDLLRYKHPRLLSPVTYNRGSKKKIICWASLTVAKSWKTQESYNILQKFTG